MSVRRGCCEVANLVGLKASGPNGGKRTELLFDDVATSGGG